MRNIFLILILLIAGVFTTKSAAQAVILRSDTLEVPCISTDAFLVPVYLDNFNNVSGLQFTLQWDSLRLDYAYITDLNPQFLGAGFDTLPATVALGNLTFAWTDLSGLSLPSNTVLFKVAFNRIGGLPAALSFTNDPTAIAVFDNQFDEILSETHNGLVKANDNQPPTIICPSFVITGGSGPTAVPNIASVASDNCGAPEIGWSATGATIYPFTTDPDASGALFNLGFSTVTYTATDAGGNTTTCTFDILLEFNITSTDLTLIANPNNLASCGETLSIDILAFNFDTISGLQFSMEWPSANLEFVSITNNNAAININASNFNLDSTGVGLLSFAWTTASLPGSSLPAGNVLFTLTYNVLGSGSIAFGNNPTAAVAFSGTDETTLVTLGANINVIDLIAPVITCPNNITVQAPGATQVPGIAPTVTDNCASPVIGWMVSGATNGVFLNDTDASDGLFNLGENVVTYTATDAGGNMAMCSFMVTVEFGINSSDLTIVANSTNAACGTGFGIDIAALNFQTVAGVQFSVHWDASLYQYTSVSNFNLPLGIMVSNFGVDSVGVGFLTFAWTSAGQNGLSVNDGDILFRLNFNLLSSTGSSIVINDYPTIRVAFDGGTFDEIPMMTFDGQVSVVDNVPPTIVCPMPAPVDAPQGLLFATVNGLEPTTLSDNCGGVPTLTYTQSGATTNNNGVGNANGDYNAGTTTVVYTATDANNNTATCSFQVVVNADAPVIIQLDTVDLGCQGVQIGDTVTVQLTVENFINIVGLQFGVTWDTSVLAIIRPYTVQFLIGGPFPVLVDSMNGTLAFFGGLLTWPNVPDDSTIVALSFEVRDVVGLATTTLNFLGPFDALDPDFLSVPVLAINGAFVFTQDNVPPVVTCPNDTVINALPQQCSASYTPLAPTATDACGAITNISIAPSTTIFNAGPATTLTYSVTDEANNTSTCSFKVSVVENNPPQIVTCPTSPILVDAVGPLCQANAFWTTPTFKDTCGQTPFLIYDNDYDSGGLFSLGSSLVNYSATDLSGNTTTCSFEVIVRDVTPPTIICPSDTVITPANGCSTIVNFNAPVATDLCDMNMTPVCSSNSGGLFAGVTTVICAVLDDASNAAQCIFTITVLDTQPPSFPNGCPSNINVVSASGNCGANPTWQAPLVMDLCDQTVSLMPSQASGTFFDVPNSPHTVTYTATDDMGNTVTCAFTVTVADTTKPVLTNCPTLPILVVLSVDSCTITLNWTPPTVADNCGAGGITLTSNLNPGIFPTGDTTVVYTATDASDNVSTCAFNVSVKDVVPPQIDCPTAPIPVPVPSPCGVTPIWTLPTAMDNCTPEAGLVYTTDYLPGDTFDAGTTTFVVRVTDASGNFDECTLIVNNNVTPRFTDIPDTIFVEMCQTAVTWIPPTALDFCPPVTITSSHAPGIIFPFGATTVTYMATDTFGNAATSTFVVVVSENIAPVFDCPVSPIVVNIGGVIISDPSDFLLSADTTASCREVELTFNIPNATDNCVTPTVTQLPGLPSGAPFSIGFNELVFSAVDSSGNMSQCAVFIEVVGLADPAPVVNPIPGCVGDEVIITATNIPGATYTWVGPVTSTTNIVTIGSLSAQNDGVYIVTANVNGCNSASDTAIVYMTVLPMAENDLTFEINPGETITFSSVLTNDLLSPAFDFEICEVSTLAGLVMNNTDGTFTYTAGETPGMVSFSYKVCSRTCELSDQAVVTIRINDTKCIFIPNIITPNGDDTNDWFTVPCLETGLFSENSLVVYNQWGDQVYEAAPYSNDPADAWRGTLYGKDGKDLPDGVYFYIFKPGPNIPPMKGFVEIFR